MTQVNEFVLFGQNSDFEGIIEKISYEMKFPILGYISKIDGKIGSGHKGLKKMKYFKFV